MLWVVLLLNLPNSLVENGFLCFLFLFRIHSIEDTKLIDHCFYHCHRGLLVGLFWFFVFFCLPITTHSPSLPAYKWSLFVCLFVCSPLQFERISRASTCLHKHANTMTMQRRIRQCQPKRAEVINGKYLNNRLAWLCIARVTNRFRFSGVWFRVWIFIFFALKLLLWHNNGLFTFLPSVL